MNLPLVREKSMSFSWRETKHVAPFIRLWLVGAPGVGKTHIANYLEKVEGFQVLRIGEILRKEIGVREFSSMKNPHAPEETNDRVAELVYDAIERQSREANRPLVIDSSPRNERQLNFIPSFHNPLEMKDLVVFVHATESIRKVRLNKRGADETRLASRATDSWEQVRPELITKLVNGGVFMTTFENDGHVDDG